MHRRILMLTSRSCEDLIIIELNMILSAVRQTGIIGAATTGALRPPVSSRRMPAATAQGNGARGESSCQSHPYEVFHPLSRLSFVCYYSAKGTSRAS